MGVKSILTVPMRVFAICQPDDHAVVGPEMDFESLPYFDRAAQLDVNPNVPYLAESVIPPPFADTNFILGQGVHLAWDLPDFLKRTKYGAQNGLEFPPVPTRWLVSRFSAPASSPDRQWVVESDALLIDPAGAGVVAMAQTSLPVDIHSGDKPIAYMGRSEPLPDWLARGGAPPEPFTSWKRVWKSGDTELPLTALGWGSPSFDIFYPNSRGVFGFHDPDGTDSHLYRVIGWYGEDGDDYWKYYLRTKVDQWGFDEIQKLDHLEASRKAELRAEQFAKQLAADLGIALPYAENVSDPDAWERMVCCGISEWLPAELLPQSNAGPSEDQLRYAMGNTPIEALTAMIAEHLLASPADPDQQELQRTKVEDRLAAILMGDRLKSQKLDIGPNFREFRHADEFVGSGGGVQWVVENVDDNPRKTPPGQQPGADLRRPPPLPEAVLPVLQTLNAAQRAYDQADRELDSARDELYADWYRYMHAAYPPPGETEEFVDVSAMRAMIAAGSLRAVQTGRQALDVLANTVASARNNLQEALARLNTDIKADTRIVDKFHWETQKRPAPRFWEPAPPALVIAIPKATAPAGSPGNSVAPTAEGVAAPAGLSCQPFSGALSLDPASFSVDALLAADATHWTAPAKAPSTDRPIFRGEWEVAVYPVATMNSQTRSSGTYDPEFILNNYRLGENEPDLDVHPELASQLAVTGMGHIYTGSTYVNQNLDDRYRGLLRTYGDLQAARSAALAGEREPMTDQTSPEYLQKAAEKAQLDGFAATVVQAKEFLDRHDLLVVTLNGFNAALLQRHESLQLNPADPLGFADYQAFAEAVAAALGTNTKGVSPDPHAPFLPIRSGALQVLNVRLVDRFGRFVELAPTDVATAISMTVRDHPDWVRLPPRLSQAARWSFRFLQAQADSLTESNSHPLSTPLHGWVIANLLDHSLDVFDPAGRRLGGLRENEKITWEPAGTLQPAGYLQEIVTWITGQPAGFLEAFLEDIEEALDNIHPEDREGQTAYSVLMGRPLAVVALGVKLELSGLPAVNNSWSDLYRDMRGFERATDGFEQVQFPYRLGEYRQRSDGLVGYWAIDGGALEPGFNVNDAVYGRLHVDQLPPQGGQSGDAWLDSKSGEWALQDEAGRNLFDYLRAAPDATIKRQDLIQPYTREGSLVWDRLKAKGYLTEEKPYPGIRHYAEANALHISPADEMQQFIALVDPCGSIHLSSGIQPVKTIQLPEQFVTDALNRMEISFLTAPLLTPEHQLELSLPAEQAFQWAWREANTWPSRRGEAPTGVEIPEEEIKPFQIAANFPPRNVLREGRLVIKHKPPLPETGANKP